MASQFVIKQNDAGDGFDVYVRDLLPHGEYAARFTHMVVDCGWDEHEAAAELYAMQPFHRKNAKPAPLSLAADYVFSYAEPGDIVQIGQLRAFVGTPAAA